MENQKLSGNCSRLQEELKWLNYETNGRSCYDGWTRFGCSCYFKFTGEKDWSGSRTDCEQRGAHLVVVNSKEEQKFISEMNKNGKSWIGLRAIKIWKSGWDWEWEWVDNSPLTQSFWETKSVKSAEFSSYAVCCNPQGQWMQQGNGPKNWICEK
ncbi:CD209 antigen-like protein A [Pholidichthys leucotaenia]